MSRRKQTKTKKNEATWRAPTFIAAVETLEAVEQRFDVLRRKVRRLNEIVHLVGRKGG
jgi:hypothetical protein